MLYSKGKAILFQNISRERKMSVYKFCLERKFSVVMKAAFMVEVTVPVVISGVKLGAVSMEVQFHLRSANTL